MKIGILTLFHGNCNWGGVLQGYALKTLLETRFPDTQADLLIYKNGHNIIYDSKVRQVLQYSPIHIIKKASKKIISKGHKKYRVKLNQRYTLFRNFMEEAITNPVVYNDESLAEAARKYDCLISGSDQVWNPNVGCAGFFQQMISDECKKISYAASIARDDLSNHERKIMLPLIAKFDAVSVREKTAKTILDRYLGGKPEITEVLDPTMMLTKQEWERFGQKSRKTYSGQYALAFFFSESIAYRKRIAEYCRKNNLILKFIPFARGEYIASDEAGEEERLYDLGPYEFVNLFQNASCVFTDSFHGAVFSILFQKTFCVFERDKKSRVSKNSRLYDLLEKFQLSKRMVRDGRGLDAVMDQKIDYAAIDKMHEQFKNDSMAFLSGALSDCQEKNFQEPTHVGELEKWQCSGCELCVSQCPKHAISMHQDEEGFYFPFVDAALCVKCGRCLNHCITRMTKTTQSGQEAFLGFHKNEKIREKSSSGGLFYALSEVVLRAGGCVYGAAYSDTFEVAHRRIISVEELPLLMTSKYVQSRMGQTFLQILEDLQNGHIVLFSGAPCQAAAVSRFIKQRNMDENLILVDFICHGVPSPGVWNSYVSYLTEKTGDKIESIHFRDKAKGWHNYHFKAKIGRSEIYETHELNPYMRSFLSDRNLRRSCYQCAFKGENYFSDITIGDAWKVEKDCPDWADDKGTSLFVIRTDKGKMLLEKLRDGFAYRSTSYEKWKMYNPSLTFSSQPPIGRTEFFMDFHSKDNVEFWNMQKKVPTKKKVRYALKIVAKKIGIEKILRRIVS